MAEMADGGIGDDSNQGSSSMSSQEKVLRNKRKYVAEIPADVPSDVSLSLTEFPRYELLAEKFQNTLGDTGSQEAQSNWSKQEQEVEELCLADWDDSMVCQLEELLSHNLSATFCSAIKKIADCGHNVDVAESAVLRSGLYYGSKDPVSNIVDGALVFLKRENECDISKYHIFDDLESLVEYTMLEMIYVLREVKPSLTIVEAMWFLLICDLNLAQACAVEGDTLSAFFGKEVSAESSSDPTLAQLKSEAKTSETILPTPHSTCGPKHSIPNTPNLQSEMPTFGGFPNLPHPMCPFHDGTPPTKEALVSVLEARGKSLGLPPECVQSICQLATMDEKTGSSRKGCLVNQRRHMLHRSSYQLEKHYKGNVSKGTVRAKFTTWSCPVLDEKLKSPPDSSRVHTKNNSSKMNTKIKKNVPVAEKSHHLSNRTSSTLVATSNCKPTPLASKDLVCALPAANSKPDASLSLETKPIPKLFDCYGIPYDKSLGKHVPQDEKDKLILMIVPQLQILQEELQSWTDWANKKVMEATRRLGKDQAELKTFRQEKKEAEKFAEDKKIFEENTTKRLSEMECALTNFGRQVETANSTADKLEEENTALKEELKSARLRAQGSAVKWKEALSREQEVLKRVQLSDKEKTLLQEVLSTNKQKVAELQHVVEKAKSLYDQIEALHKHEEKVKEKLLIEASSIRKERKQLAYVAKAEEEMVRQKAENEMQKYEGRIKELESKISELRLVSESSKIAALRRGINAPAFNGCQQAPKVTKRLAVFRDNFRATSARAERECVMCLTEEMQVVFLPCAHQPLCANCNELHEKQGMTDCPSCRTPIKWRIIARFASRRHL